MNVPFAPPLNRSPMAPERAPLRASDSPDPRGDWQRAGTARRAVLLALVTGQTAIAAHAMLEVLPYHGEQPLEMLLLALFSILFAWVSAGFWTAMMGFLVLARGGDRHAITRKRAGKGSIDPRARTAIVMPICNEDVARVFAGLRATYRSLERTGEAARFDFFVLSDSADPDTRVAETEAWAALVRELGAAGRLFYRWRRHRIKKKSGNVADFCRRWGRNYRYMVVLDADSVMSGDCLTTLVRLMEANPNAGIIQTLPRAAGRDTFYARVQQFAGRAYGPLFTAGMHYWQLGESHYWGHNAIIRVAPFIEHCALARLPGRGPLGGEILSHDFVEAALMRRAGWAVWIAYDLAGSYEEMPPNLLDELKRDRRWCQGNLINSRLLFAEGLHPAHRAVFMTGAMAYLSAPLWFLFLVAWTALLALHTLVPPAYFVEPGQLFPRWPEWRLEWAVGLFSATAVLLFLPKVLSGLLILLRGPAPYGGAAAVTGSVLLEVVLSALLAPVRMLFHTWFVLGALTGFPVQWKSPPREDAQTTWGEALRRHGWQALTGLGWAVAVYTLDPASLWWLLPIAGALVLAVPISVLTSRRSIGRAMRRAGLFVIPEEASAPRELAEVAESVRRRAPPPGFVHAVIDARMNALACEAARRPPALSAERLALVRRACRSGPAALGPRERSALLDDSLMLARLHQEVRHSRVVHPGWYAPPSAAEPVLPTPVPALRGAGLENASSSA